MEISFVDQDHCFGRSLRDEIAEVVLRRDTCGRIVRIADVNETFLRGRAHFLEIVREV